MESFSADLNDNLTAIADARVVLLDVMQGMSADDLTAARRGGWSVREVLRHLIDSEVGYAKVIAFLRSGAVDLGNASDEDVASGDAAVAALARVRAALLKAIEGVDESTFYDLRSLGKEQYSVVSVLENVASHDHEHADQLRKTLGT